MKQEKKQPGRLKMLAGYYKPYKGLFFADLFFAFLGAAVTLVIPLMVRYIMNSISEMPAAEAKTMILKIGVGMLVLILVQLGSRYFITYYGHMMGAYIEHDMRNEIFSHYQKLSFAFYDNQKVGQLLSRITSDLFDITELLHHGPEDILISVIKLFGALIILMNVKPQMALLCFAVVIIMLIYALIYNKKMKSAFKENRVRMGEINSQIEDSLSGIRVVKSFGNEKREIEKFRKGNERFVDSKRVTYRYMAGYHAGMDAFTTLITVTALVSGAMFLAAGDLSATDLVTFLLYINNFTEPVTKLVNFTEQFQNGYSGYDRFLEMMSIAPDIEDAPDAVSMDHVKGDIRFENVSFHYEDHNEKVLSNVNLEVKPGDYVALVGTSGAGKTTLCSLIPRFYDATKGCVKVDGVDVRNMTQHELRDRLGYVPQKGVLFSGTIDSNIRYGKPDMPEEDVKLAAQIAQSDDFIEAKPEGYKAPISQGGNNVSGGQKQRLSIARAIAKKPEILIFDDSFSALDFKTDSKLRKALKEKTKDITTIIVAQRISTILNADQIIVLDDGNMAGIGTHKELMKNCEVYRQIAMSQLSEEELA